MIPIVLRSDVPEPMAVQIAAEIRRLVAAGALEPGQPVPSSRALASQLGVSRGTVVAAYDQLVAESYLVATPGGKTRIHPDTSARPVAASAGARPARRATTAAGMGLGGDHDRRESRPAQLDLTPHVHLPVVVDDSSWREAWRAAATPQQGAPNQPGESVQGLAQLREAIAEHLRLMRSMVVDPADIFVTTGARDGLALVLAALGADSGPQSAVGFESPGYPGLRRVMTRVGVEALPLAVDAQGLVASELPAAVGAILVTPNHLYPVGGSMPAPRRFELLARAEGRGVLVIEDDLDSEYRHVGAILPSLWELAPQSVVHLGTFNQVLTPDARIGYLIAPAALHAGLLAARGDLGSGASAIAQRAVASYLSGGGLRRHLIRRRREIVRRREVVSAALGEFGVQMNAGANAIVELPSHAVSLDVQRSCAEVGVLVGDLGAYWNQPAQGLAQGPAQAPVAGIVIAYGGVDFGELGPAVEVVAREVRRVIPLAPRS